MPDTAPSSGSASIPRRDDLPGGRGLSANPARPAVVGLCVVLVFVAAFLGWGWFAPVSGAVVASGVLQVEGQRQSVQHPYGGVVLDLMVREGDRVEEGQVLLTLSDTEPRSALDVLLVEQSALLAQEARLIAERDGGTAPKFGPMLTDRQNEPAVAQAIANERAVMAARVNQYESETRLLARRITLLGEQQRGTEAQLEGLERQAALIEEEAKGSRQLLQSGYTAKTRVLELEREAARLRAERGAKLAEIAATQEEVGSAELAVAQLERSRTTEVTTELRTVQSRLAELEPKVGAARDVLRRTEITAPATGAVVGVSIFTRGGVVQPGARLLDIVPTSNPLIVEGRLLPTEVNEITPGREADVRLTNFVRNERPVIRGEVATVSADRLTDERTGQDYYAIRVRMNPDDLERADLDLQAGMPAQIVMTTEARTLVDYLIAPLLDEITGAFRER